MKAKNKNQHEGKEILEGSRAIALTINNIGPEVVSAYPITPQTHIVEDLAKFKANGQANFEYVRAESEFAAASIVLGASAAGARVYSATSSQGLLLMAEVLYNISGMRLPIIMTCANRAISSPINIWNDHSDAMSVAGSGWLQFFAENHQEAVYQHLLAYKVAEKTSLPALVNVDGFILTHSYEPVAIPAKTLIKKYLPVRKLEPGTFLDTNNPVTMGGFFSPNDYLDTRKDICQDFNSSLAIIKKEYLNLKKIFKLKDNGNGLLEYSGAKKPKIILIAMGSLAGTIKETLKKYTDVGLLKITTFRPFPAEEIKKAVKGCLNIAIIEKAINPGSGGPLYLETKAAIYELGKINIQNYIAGLGGRDISQKQIEKVIKEMRGRAQNKIKFVN
ncbi:MAG: pyruvate ferredoxin oxidoreductase [Candidatus Falkowbacteria bacterium]|nr:MAG: pyruvate ferredoxin oxidoreductase [Candidatus Falkowbacteria bacterium]